MKQKGFGLVEIIIIVFILGIIGFIAWTVLSRQDQSSSPTNSSTSEDTEEIAASEQSASYKWSSGQGPYRDKVTYATSTDLLNWQDSGKVLIEHASVPDAVLKDGALYMYFVDVSTDGKPEQIGMMQSTDNGKNWSERQFVTIKGDGIASIVPVDPDPVLLEDGKIRLYYYDIAGRSTAESKAIHKIYSAVSSDGVNFRQEDGVRFEEESILDPDVLKVGDVWRLYVGDPEGKKVTVATSTDGLNFTREGIAYEGSSVPNAIYEAGNYYLFTAGINIATSKDGKTYTKSTSNFKTSNGITADPGVVKLGDKNYLMVYKTSSPQTQATPSPQ